jgi:malate/lactate dehydrogenase
VILGKKGVERIVEIDLNTEEQAMMHKSAELIRSTMAHLQQPAKP